MTGIITSVDILTIDSEIRKNFEEEHDKLPAHCARLKDLDTALQNTDLRRSVRLAMERARDELQKHISDTETQKQFHFYVMETTPLIERYKEMLNTPMKVSFLGKVSKSNKKKKQLIQEYLQIASKYVDIEVDSQPKAGGEPKVACSNCPNRKDFEILDGNIYVCNKCYARQTVLRHNSSYTDIDRVNISSKYMYDPKIHFRDCIKQYQGKQNCTIPQKVYDDLEQQFGRHHLLEGGPNASREERFRNITKNHILIFLKELGYANHYENVHLIHYNFTGIRPDDIGYLEDQLLDDFDRLIEVYHREFKDIKRKNFINTQYVLYQLLRHHKHPCKKEEFVVLKTIDRKCFHDEVMKVLMSHLGMNMFPTF